jgi:lysophospholipase L1-like esterase
MQGKGKLILCFGDSLTAGYYAHGLRFAPYAEHLTTKDGAYKGMDFGTSGMTSREMVSWVDEVLRHDALKGYELFAFVALGGTNDLGGNASAEQIAKNMGLVAAKAKVRGFERVCVATIPTFPNAVRAKRVVDKIEATNALLRKLDAEIVPLAEAVSPEVATIWDDGLHNNPKGYELYADAIKRHLKI